MAKTDKELAVELYSAYLISAGHLYSNPNVNGNVKNPTIDEMIAHITDLTTKLSRIQVN